MTLITKEELEKRRTPSQLQEFVANVRKRVEADSEQLRLGRRKKGLYKEFVDEIVPLADFAPHIYPDDVFLQPVIGNQGYDAIVFDNSGAEIDRIEIAKPYDGKKVSKDNDLLEDRGYGAINIYDLGFGEELEMLASWIDRSANSKALKDYSDYTLVIVAALESLPHEEIAATERRAEILQAKLSTVRFRAKRVFLAVPALKRCYEISFIRNY